MIWSISVTNPAPSLTDCTSLSLEMKREAGVDMTYIRRTLMKCRCSLPLTLLFLCYIREISNSEEHSASCCNTSVYGRVIWWQSQWPHCQRMYSPDLWIQSHGTLDYIVLCSQGTHADRQNFITALLVFYDKKNFKSYALENSIQNKSRLLFLCPT